jgi:endoglucanase
LTSPSLHPNTRFFVPPPPDGALAQASELASAGHLTAAVALCEMILTPQAVWLNGGTPDEVRQHVSRTMRDAAAAQALPVFVAYNVPFRDCGHYSAGGARDSADYAAWIDGVAAGLGDGHAVVLLEPDGLGFIPYERDGDDEACQPDLEGTGLTRESASAARYAQLAGAVARLERQPALSVYLDGTHSAWLEDREIARRLVKAGVQRAQGFFVNLSNYQSTTDSIDYGTRVCECIASALGTPEPTAHFVIDTSRNGRGPNDMSGYAEPPYSQSASTVATLAAGNWCNDPAAGLGTPPSADTGVPLLDAYLWVKTPGQSDGEGNAAGGTRAWDYSIYSEPGWPTDPAEQARFDPLWGVYAPPAGEWFAELATTLIKNARPQLD